MKTFDTNYVAEVKISYSSKIPTKLRPSVTSSQIAADILKQTWLHIIIDPDHYQLSSRPLAIMI